VNDPGATAGAATGETGVPAGTQPPRPTARRFTDVLAAKDVTPKGGVPNTVTRPKNAVDGPWSAPPGRVAGRGVRAEGAEAGRSARVAVGPLDGAAGTPVEDAGGGVDPIGATPAGRPAAAVG